MTDRAMIEVGAVDARRAIADGRLDRRAYAEALAARNRARDPQIGVWAHFDEAAFLAAAELSGEGCLGGLPIAIKDIFDTHDMPTQCGSPIFAGRRPLRDAAAVAAIRAAGGVVMGKSVTTEFAYAHPGVTRNPNHPGHTPGGSSSGSAAAVAAGIVPLAIGTQTAGSVIRPAAFCGVVGFKPSFGRIDRAGVFPCAASFDTIGAFARGVADAWLLVEAMSGAELPAPLAAPARPPLIGLCRTPEWDIAAEETRSAVAAAAATLAAAGAEVADVALPDIGACLQQVHLDIMAHEAALVFAREECARPLGLSAPLTALIAAGEAISDVAYRRRLDQAASARSSMAAVFGTVDAILTPSAIGEAPAGLASTGDAVCNRVWTLLHGPCVHLPTGRGPRGLPIGVQLVGPVGGDAALAGVALWAERILAQ